MAPVIYDKSTNDVTAIYTGIMDSASRFWRNNFEFSVSASNGNYYPSATISDLLVVIMKNPQLVSVSAECLKLKPGARNGAFYCSARGA